MQPSRSHLYGVSLFRDCRARAETQIYTHLNSRIEEFCSLASYDGIFGGPGEGTLPLDQLPDAMSEDDNPRTSEYMVDMMAWLASTFAAFTHLPPKVAHTACISACKYIVKILQRILMGPEVRFDCCRLKSVFVLFGQHRFACVLPETNHSPLRYTKSVRVVYHLPMAFCNFAKAGFGKST